MKTILPAPFKARVINGKAIAGICLIRLKHVRPKGLPAFMGIGSENGAHRIAVEWEEKGELKEGVYIPRRDSSSRFNTLVGGRIFPGIHHYAKFDVHEQDGKYQVAFESTDGAIISIDASVATELNKESVFKNMDAASAFFKAGATGYSPNGDCYDGLKLNTYTWDMKPMDVINVRSIFFENELVFPKGSVQFDNALLMVNIEHEWTSVAGL